MCEVPEEHSDCPICFSPLKEIVEFDDETPKNESSSLIIDYIGKRFYFRFGNLVVKLNF